MRLLPLSRTRPTRAPHGLERPKGWFPGRVGVHVPPGGCIHVRNGFSVPPAHPLTGPILKHMEGDGQAPGVAASVSIADPPASGRSWPLQSWARYVQSRPPLADVINWSRPLTFLLRGDVYPCAGGSWTQLSIALLNHGARGRSPAYLWVIGMAVCGDKDMVALATICAENLQTTTNPSKTKTNPKSNQPQPTTTEPPNPVDKENKENDEQEEGDPTKGSHEP